VGEHGCFTDPRVSFDSRLGSSFAVLAQWKSTESNDLGGWEFESLERR